MHTEIYIEDICSEATIKALKEQDSMMGTDKVVFIETDEADQGKSRQSGLQENRDPISQEPAAPKARYPAFLKRPVKKGNAEEAMREASLWLEQRDIPYEVPSPYQIKIGAINYYPQRGVIMIDGERQKRTESGLDGLASLFNADMIKTSFGGIRFIGRQD